jgi:hypothetical protein
LTLGSDAWQVERIASMLNYFLFQLVGPHPKALRVKEPEKYECFEDVVMGGMDGYTWKMITYCKPLEEEPRRWCFCT